MVKHRIIARITIKEYFWNGKKRYMAKAKTKRVSISTNSSTIKSLLRKLSQESHYF